MYQNSFTQRYQLVPVEAVSHQNLKLKRKSARFCPSGSKQVFHCPCETIPSGSLSTRRPGCSGAGRCARHGARAWALTAWRLIAGESGRPGLGVDGMASPLGLRSGQPESWFPRLQQHMLVCARTLSPAAARRLARAEWEWPGRTVGAGRTSRWCRARCGAVLMCSLYSVQLARRSGWGSFSFGGY